MKEDIKANAAKLIEHALSIHAIDDGNSPEDLYSACYPDDEEAPRITTEVVGGIDFAPDDNEARAEELEYLQNAAEVVASDKFNHFASCDVAGLRYPVIFGLNRGDLPELKGQGFDTVYISKEEVLKQLSDMLAYYTEGGEE